jgi:hypothetical protein
LIQIRFASISGPSSTKGCFKAHSAIGGGIFTMAMTSADEKVRADLSKFYAKTQMSWKETTTQQLTGPDNGPVEVKDVSAIDVIRARNR